MAVFECMALTKSFGAEKGVRVRSGPSTEYEILASLSNNAAVRIVESAGDGWYKIKFSGDGGAETTGYMKGEYLKND